MTILEVLNKELKKQYNFIQNRLFGEVVSYYVTPSYVLCYNKENKVKKVNYTETLNREQMRLSESIGETEYLDSLPNGTGYVYRVQLIVDGEDMEVLVTHKELINKLEQNKPVLVEGSKNLFNYLYLNYAKELNKVQVVSYNLDTLKGIKYENHSLPKLIYTKDFHEVSVEDMNVYGVGFYYSDLVLRQSLVDFKYDFNFTKDKIDYWLQ